jgi:hypothetical protein
MREVATQSTFRQPTTFKGNEVFEVLHVTAEKKSSF